MKKLTKNEQMLWVVLIGVMSLYFFTKKVHDPLSADIKALVKSNNSLVAELTELKEEPVETKGIERSIRKLSKQLDTVRLSYNEVLASTMTMRERVQEVALEISGLASDNGLTVREMLPADVEGAELGLPPLYSSWQKTFSLSPYRVRLEGDYLDFRQFLEEFSSRPLLSIFGGIHIEQIDDNGLVAISGTILI